MINVDKITKWLIDRGVEIIPCTNDFELLRFRGSEIGVIYKSGKVSNKYTANTISCYRNNKKWDGKPINTGRNNSYKKQKKILIIRDGANCFYCGKPMNNDITVEHLIALSSGGKNTLANMVLCHYECNQKVKNISINEKVNFAIKNRIIYGIYH